MARSRKVTQKSKINEGLRKINKWGINIFKTLLVTPTR